jgi:hypothetical protein
VFNAKIIYGNCIAIYQWLSTIKWILINRGNDSYGRTELINSLVFFKALRKSKLENLISAEEFVSTLLQDLWPKISPFQMIRRGPHFDSGYMVAELTEVNNVISGGAGKNIDFELSFALEGSTISICDPFVDELPVFHNNMYHYKVLLDGIESNKKMHSLTLDEFEKIVGLRSGEVNLLKLDIEGDEVNLLGQGVVNLDNYDQIVIELHDLHKITEDQFRKKFKVLKSNLLRNHEVIHFNGNNNGLLLNFGSYLIPEIFELTLLHKKYFMNLTKQSYHSASILQDDVNNPQRLPLLNIYSYLCKISGVNWK